METKEIKTRVKVCSLEELGEEDRRLVEKAKEMTRASYAPYSRFHVGAAILLANGEIVGGPTRRTRPSRRARAASEARASMPPRAIRAWLSGR